MRKDNLFTGERVRTGLINGIKKVATAVGGTMGTGGSNAIIEAIESPGHMTTNDGYSIANSVYLADPIENIGKNILLESINRANKQSGDGSSTTCVLTAAIIEEGQKYFDKVTPMELKRSLEACIPLIEESIAKQKRDIVNDQGEIDLVQLEQVVSISAESDEIGKTISKIYSEIGKDGIIHWDISKTSEDSYDIGTGITIEDSGYYSPYMCDATEAGQSTNVIRLKNPHILITTQKVTSAMDFETLCMGLNSKGTKDLVVFCDDIDPLVMNDLVLTRMKQGFRVILTRMPTIWKDQWYEDLAIATGAKVVGTNMGLPLNQTTLAQLGSADHMVITKDQVFIDGIKDVTEHIATLKAEATDDASMRISRLNTKTARYFVGAHSESALAYKRLKVEDAISAGWQAMHGGIVAGGGVALRDISFDIATKTYGYEILQKALCAPIQQILVNAGIDGNERHIDNFGYDTRTGKHVDMFEAGITDPANVLVNAVKNAISVAASVLTANTLVVLPREDQPEMQTPPVVI